MWWGRPEGRDGRTVKVGGGCGGGGGDDGGGE